MIKAQILLYEHECGLVGADIRIGNRSKEHLYTKTPRDSLSLELLGRNVGIYLGSKGITFGEYEIIHGKTSIAFEKVGKIENPRVYSTINFAILNEMMRLTKPNSLEAKAA